MSKSNFKNGKWAFKATGATYYAQLRADGVWLWKGAGITAFNYCGVQPLDKFLAQFEKLPTAARVQK